MSYDKILLAMRNRHALGVHHALKVIAQAIPGIGKRIASGPVLIGSEGQRMAWEEKEDATENLHGSAYVVLQGEITATVAYVKRLHEIDPTVSLTTTTIEKRDVVAFDSTKTIFAIDVAANYFKHHDEWGADWSLASSQAKSKTVEPARALGLCPEERENLTALTEKLTGGRLLDLEEAVYRWRRDLCSAYAKELHAAGKL